MEIKCYNLFLDDVRVPKNAYVYKKEPFYIDREWTIVRSYHDFIQTVAERYSEGFFPCIISFDHDLTLEHYRMGTLTGFSSFDETATKTPTGWHCLKWFLKFCEVNDYALPKILLHSQNDAGIKNMQSLIDEYKTNRRK
jgi:hypothetical protein